MIKSMPFVTLQITKTIEKKITGSTHVQDKK